MPHFATYDLLILPRYRAVRYTLLCIAYLIFSYSETSYHYAHAPMAPFSLLFLSAFLSKAIASAFLFTLIINLLQKRRYTLFLISVILISCSFICLQQITSDKMICRYFNIRFWRDGMPFWYTLLDMLSLNVVWIMVFSAFLMGRMLKFWNIETLEKQQIQASKLQMETESWKEQVSPSLLCSTLHKGSEQAQKSPQVVSDMLMQLSRMLRYQLYDCRHEKVLLDSEIKFLKEYLSILKYNGACTDFSISVTGQTMGISIPPLLFTPLLQAKNTPSETSTISTRFEFKKQSLTFELRDNHTYRNERNIRQRLEQLFPQKHELTIEPKHVILKIQIQ